ncbi:hypothetical protein HOY80DRAFT_638726 [Tuber brumale]|nr:hypothetical protein HOY80DRAFT_638726 [Tuber brumale]
MFPLFSFFLFLGRLVSSDFLWTSLVHMILQRHVMVPKYSIKRPGTAKHIYLRKYDTTVFLFYFYFLLAHAKQVPDRPILKQPARLPNPQTSERK